MEEQDLDYELDEQGWITEAPESSRGSSKGKGKERAARPAQPNSYRILHKQLGIPGPSGTNDNYGENTTGVRGQPGSHGDVPQYSEPGPARNQQFHLGEFGPTFRLPVSAPQPSSLTTTPQDNDTQLSIQPTVNAVVPSGFQRINLAEVAERSGRPPDDEYILPPGRPKDFDIRFLGLALSNMGHIGRKTSTWIGMPSVQEPNTVRMWGQPDQIAMAKEDLRALHAIVDSQFDADSSRVGGWDRINVQPSHRVLKRMEETYKKELVKKRFRHAPPIGHSFRAVGVFLWPAKEIDPYSALGLSLEGLDPIRFECEVYILYNRRTCQFRALGDRRSLVEKATDRIYGTFCEIAARARKPNKMVLVDSPSVDLPAKLVGYTSEHHLIGRQVTVKRVALNTGIRTYLCGPKPTKDFIRYWKDKRIILEKANLDYIRRAVQAGLHDIVYYRGIARLRVYFGRLVLFGYRVAGGGGLYDLEDYIPMTRNSQTNAELIRSIGSWDGTASDEETARELMAYFGAHKSIFQQTDESSDYIDPTGLGLPEPQISATMDLQVHTEEGRALDVRLEMTFERMPDTDRYKATQSRWIDSSVDKDVDFINPRTTTVDIKVQDIEKDLAFQMELRTQQVFNDWETYSTFNQFMRDVRIEKIPDELDPAGPPAAGQADNRRKILRVQFINHPGLTVCSLIQKSKYRYWIRRSRYTVEVTKYEALPVNDISSYFPDGIHISYRNFIGQVDVRYGISLGNDEWDTKLAAHQGLKIGQRAQWSPEIDKFFTMSQPEGVDPSWGVNNGTEECFYRVKDLLRLIHSAQLTVKLRKEEEANAANADAAN
ncbi:hypothetical protein EDC01DRAFT_633397 [Geopyxis carbonaria]|nr:hypothetical protein EDC01DRAFT_633397 [Geopyxis carbonaria]